MGQELNGLLQEGRGMSVYFSTGYALLLAAILFAGYRLCIIIYRLWYHPLAKVPGPSLMAITNLPYQIETTFLGTWHDKAVTLHKTYGPMVRVAPNTVLLDGSIGWPQVFGHRPKGQAEYQKYPGFYFKDSETVLVGSPTHIHRRQRKQIGPAFSEASMERQEKSVTQFIHLFLQRLSEHSADNQAVDIVNWLHITTFDIIGDLCFGESFHGLEGDDYHPWVLFILNAFKAEGFRRFCRDYPIMFPVLSLFAGREMMKKAEDQLEFGRTKAKARMALGAEPADGRRDLLTYMMQTPKGENKPMEESVMILNSSSITVAGAETTAIALSGFFFYMGKDTERLRILAGEIRQAFKSEDEISIKSAAHLEYLQATIEETLRIYPPATLTPTRMSPGADVDGIHMPQGVGVMVSIWATNRNPEHFHEPNSYRPERWLKPSHPRYDDRFANDNRSMCKVFSHGPRDCIGKNLAYAEMRLIISLVLYRFDFSLAPGQEDWHTSQTTSITWEKRPLKIHLTARQ
ncbi:cytochrome P450 [Stachybotrys elegans]|uniref:Cytochrome P450 n=1 Tax=Stachybotrys elegans TaxID=80388 RepID=A0A8K0SWI4_9HYPO|nr:cytochrome P450 [Stachybotrys elegans]